MSLLTTINPENATGEVAEMYRGIQSVMGRVPSVMQLWSASPFLMRQNWDYSNYMMQHPTLTMQLSATIRMLISEQNDCRYCIDFNAALLIDHCQWTEEQVLATRANYADSPLNEREKCLLGFVLKATHDSHSVTADDVANLRTQGWTDCDIYDALNHAARMVAGDIMINALKVERDF